MGKPPISNAAMSSMHETMQRMRAAKRSAAQGLSPAERAVFQLEPESLFAALLSQANRRDMLLTQGRFPGADLALDTWFADRTRGPRVHVCHGTAEECAGVATGVALDHARGAPTSTPKPVVFGVLREFPALEGVLRLVQEHSLPLLLVVQAEPETRADAQHRLLRTKVPIMTVDAADAIAVCRVTQESMLRARSGWGGVVIHAVRPAASADPIQQIESHMQSRGILSPDEASRATVYTKGR